MPKLLPKANQIEAAWIRQLCELPLGSVVHFEVADKREAKARMKTVKELLAALDRDDPVTASRIHVFSKVADNRLFVAMELRTTSPLLGFVKLPDGTVQATTVQVDPERGRKIKLMLRDGMSVEEIGDVLGSPMTQAEIREHIEKGRRS